MRRVPTGLKGIMRVEEVGRRSTPSFAFMGVRFRYLRTQKSKRCPGTFSQSSMCNTEKANTRMYRLLFLKALNVIVRARSGEDTNPVEDLLYILYTNW